MPTPIPPGPLAGETQINFINNGTVDTRIPVGGGGYVDVPANGLIVSYGLTDDELTQLALSTNYEPPQPEIPLVDVT